jgi:hypothetical protein
MFHQSSSQDANDCDVLAFDQTNLVWAETVSIQNMFHKKETIQYRQFTICVNAFVLPAMFEVPSYFALIVILPAGKVLVVRLA